LDFGIVRALALGNWGFLVAVAGYAEPLSGKMVAWRRNTTNRPHLIRSTSIGAPTSRCRSSAASRAVAKRFGPDRIILFGSHAYGSPHPDSDVDILVVMSARDRHSQAVKIRWEVPAPFPMDLLVRTPQQMTSGLAEGDTFLTEIVSKGKVSYENGAKHASIAANARLTDRNHPE
jgi:predicted nucleotidyltransferase